MVKEVVQRVQLSQSESVQGQCSEMILNMFRLRVPVRIVAPTCLKQNLKLKVQAEKENLMFESLLNLASEYPA